jgi:hypothetical protein
MEKVVSITTDNTVEIKEVESIEYETLYEAVNGLVELVSINEDIDMWLNEEGKLIGLEPNVLATLLFNKAFSQKDVIMGNIIITGGADDEGNTVGLSDSSIIDIFAMLQGAIDEASGYVDNE